MDHVAMFNFSLKSLFYKKNQNLDTVENPGRSKFDLAQFLTILISISSLALSISLFLQDYKDNINAAAIVYHEEVSTTKASGRLGDGFPVILGYTVFNSGNRPLFVRDLGLTYEDFSGIRSVGTI